MPEDSHTFPLPYLVRISFFSIWKGMKFNTYFKCCIVNEVMDLKRIQNEKKGENNTENNTNVIESIRYWKRIYFLRLFSSSLALLDTVSYNISFNDVQAFTRNNIMCWETISTIHQYVWDLPIAIVGCRHRLLFPSIFQISNAIPAASFVDKMSEINWNDPYQEATNINLRQSSKKKMKMASCAWCLMNPLNHFLHE